ncbi:MAG: beta-ketoacyl-[acyl-carrier-protein] synthase family protein [Dysgonamonadaceae bacterium]|jgi:3-oxoacyl-[acyl-carrier-protein] synthase-1|nr:beta-ketoacyl-[acyl-carrier-protein] synthase family protein [Dysgonamonadaceae bacterium]
MRVVVSGIGIVSSIGRNIAETLDSLEHKRSGLNPLTLFESKYKGVLPVGEVDLPVHEEMSRTAFLGMYAAEAAFLDAKLDCRKNENLRIGFISGTSVGGMDRSEKFYSDYLYCPSKGRLRDVIGHDCGDGTEKIAKHLGISDYLATLSTACSSGANAIITAARLIKNGFLDCAIAGGTDALCKFTLNGFSSLKIVDDKICRPFDASREGLNLGEGAGYLVLEREDNHYDKAYCSLSGYANVCEAYHQTASSPEGEGAYLAMAKALENAGINPSEVDYINLHGTGTPNNDLAEGNAVKRLFGDKPPMLSSTKAFTGHTLGACGGIEAAFSALAIQKGIVFPNLNFKTPIPEHGLIPETEFRKGLNIKTVMSNSFGFGGNMSTLIFSKL